MLDQKSPHLTPGARRIRDVASELFYRHGIHAIGVDTIAAESGVTKRTLYDRFGSKDMLVVSYLQHRHDVWWVRLEQCIASTASPRALAVFDVYGEDAAWAVRGCAFLNAAGELPADHPAREVIRTHKQAVRQRLSELIMSDQPEIQDAEGVAGHLFLLVEGAFAHRGLADNDQLLVEARELGRRLLRHESASAQR